MHFVTDKFLDQLSAPDGPPIGAMVPVRVPESAPFLDIEVLSSLHVAGPELGGERGPAEAQIEQLRDRLVEDVRRRRQRFNQSPAYAAGDGGQTYRGPHLLISCGDMIATRKDGSAEELERARAAYEQVCLPALDALRGGAADGCAGELLAIPGDEDVFRGGGGGGTEKWGPTNVEVDAYPYFTHFAKPMVGGALPDRPHDHPVATIFLVSQLSSGAAPATRDVPLACVVIIGFDSNAIHYEHALAENLGQVNPEQLERARRLVQVLRSSVGRTTPLYVLGATHHNLLLSGDHHVWPPGAADETQFLGKIEGVAGESCSRINLCLTNHVLVEAGTEGTSNAAAFLQLLQELRTSVLVHGAMHQRLVSTLTSTPLALDEPPREITIFGAPDHRPNLPTSGLSRIRLDLWRGEAEIAIAFDTSEADESQTRPVMSRPLTSASRISTGERRLYSKVSGLVEEALEEHPHAPALVRFIEHVNQMWDEAGYAALSMDDGTLPAELAKATRQGRYFLLLLLREDGGGYEMLLNRHSPQTPSNVAEWDTLLMPAFRSVRDLLSRLQFDVDRQMRQAQDLDQSARARDFDEAVEAILKDQADTMQDDIWQEHLRDVASTVRVKISPTTGLITEYNYHLVVLTPFVRSEPTSAGEGSDGAHVGTIREWLAELPSVQLEDAPPGGRQQLPIESIQTDGSGLRWDPASAEDEDRASRPYPPGSVWFPLPHLGDERSHWRLVPSIVARNADVMTWVDEQLGIGRPATRGSRRGADGRFTPWLVMGRMQEVEGYHVAGGPWPFEWPTAEEGRGGVARASTRQAMELVEYSDAWPLAGQFPYRGLRIARLVLARRRLVTRAGSSRDAICVFEAPLGCTRSELEAVAGSTERAIGVLRPAQRYVLRGGLHRAANVNAFMEETSPDAWGFVQASYEGAGEPVSLTPPIVEQVSDEDLDGSVEGTEFLVCDGNHRIVHAVWRSGSVLPVIGVIGRPHQPYYARPFSPYEWDMTSDNELTITPPTRFKYAPRKIPKDVLERKGLTSREDAFRMYFRDFNKGFGFVGGQGGRFV